LINYLIDTDWMVEVLKGKAEAIQLLDWVADQGAAISIITYAELLEGIVGFPQREIRERQLEALIASIDVLPIDFDVARRFAVSAVALRQGGVSIPDLDLLIAATALRHDLTLVSRDRHFERIPDLRRHQQSPA
jgi:tRNA(fMet)-specific endonuclease VapC